MRSFLRSTALMGTASLIWSGAAVLRLKVFALVLGPSGLGFVAVLQSVVSAFAVLADFGIGGAVTREVARAGPETEAAARVRRAATFLALLFGGVAACLIWLFRVEIAKLAFGGPEYSEHVGVVALALPAGTLAGVLFGIIASHRQAGRAAMARISAALVGTAAAVMFVVAFESAGVPWAIASVQIVLMAAAWLFLPRRTELSTRRWSMGLAETGSLLRLGGAVVAASLATVLTEFLVRTYLTRNLGLESTGQYQAAWALSALLTGLVLSALVVDYFPKISSLTGEPGESRGIFVRQIQNAVLIALPALLLMAAAPGLVTRILFTADFVVTPTIIRWHMVGDALRIVGWIQGSTLLARGQLRAFLLTQGWWNLLYLASVLFLCEKYGLASIGAALSISYALTLPLQGAALGRSLGGPVITSAMVPPVLASLAVAGVAAVHQWFDAWAPQARGFALLVAIGCLWKIAVSWRADRERGHHD